MLRRITFILVSIAWFGVSKAQHLPQYSQYFLNDFAINPAVAGSTPMSEFRTTSRNQWVGITDAPRTFNLSVHSPLAKQNMGLGGNVFTDIVGPTRRVGANFAYAYHLKVAENTKLAMGLSAGILQFGIDASKITLRDQGDQYFSSGLQSVLVPDFGFGLYLYHDRYFIGASAPQINQSRLRFFTTETRAQLEDHYFATAGYKFDLQNDWEVQPMVMLRHVAPVPVQVDISTRVIYQDKIWAGLTYRTRESVAAMFGFTYQDQLMFGYSYDYAVSGLQKYSSGSHELMLGIRFGKKGTPVAL